MRTRDEQEELLATILLEEIEKEVFKEHGCTIAELENKQREAMKKYMDKINDNK